MVTNCDKVAGAFVSIEARRVARYAELRTPPHWQLPLDVAFLLHFKD